MVDIAVDAHQHCGQADKAVQNRHQLWHFRHFDFLRQANADSAANDHRQQDPDHITAVRAKYSGNQRNRHTADTENITPLRGLMTRKTGKATDEQNRSHNIGCSD